MRILHVLEPADGGAATHVRDLIGGQLQRGHRVDAVVSDRGPLAADLRGLGAGVVALDLRPELVAPGADLRAERRLVALLRRRDWDVVHTHDSKAGALARPLAWALGLPVVHSPHMLAYTTQAARGRGAGRRRLTLEIERALSRVTGAIVVPSEHMRGEVVGDGVAPADRVTVVPHGYDPPPAQAAADPVPPGEGPVVGFLSRMTLQKDPLTLVEALGRLERPFRAALVGDGELAGAVRDRVAELGLASRVVVAPFEGAAPALAAFDIYVLPSLYESFGIGLLEAMAQGLPVVATGVGGIPEVVTAGETALLVEPGDPAALAAALDRLLADAELRARMGAAGRRRAQGMTIAAMAAAHDAVYERLRR